MRSHRRHGRYNCPMTLLALVVAGWTGSALVLALGLGSAIGYADRQMAPPSPATGPAAGPAAGPTPAPATSAPPRAASSVVPAPRRAADATVPAHA